MAPTTSIVPRVPPTTIPAFSPVFTGVAVLPGMVLGDSELRGNVDEEEAVLDNLLPEGVVVVVAVEVLDIYVHVV
jgi:hypothetical protein